MKFILHFLWMLITYCLVEIIIFLPLYLIGVLIFPIVYKYSTIINIESNINTNEQILGFKNNLLNEWLGNREDGLLPDWWKQKNGTAFSWFIRNPICNMRFWPIVSTLPKQSKTDFVGSLDHIPDTKTEHGWFLCWEGLYTGFYYQGNTFGLWIGWKCNPRDKNLNAPTDYRYKGLGTACQFWKV